MEVDAGIKIPVLLLFFPLDSYNYVLKMLPELTNFKRAVSNFLTDRLFTEPESSYKYGFCFLIQKLIQVFCIIFHFFF